MATFITQEQRAKLIELYIGYFNRAPEAAGLNYWAGELLSALNAGQTEEQALKSIADRFYDAGVQYGIFSNGMTVEEFIRTVYQNVLGRDEVDAAGMTYWTQKLTSGEVSRGQFVRQVIQEAKDYVAAAPANDPYKWVGTYLENRKAVGEWFANNSAGLTGQDAIAKGTAIIANNVTKATAQAGQTAAEAIAAAQAAQQSQQGQTFMLTANQDTLTGTAGNDTFVAGSAQDGAGNLINTLQTVDNVNGGDGNDTINITLTDATGTSAADTIAPTLTSVENVVVRFADTTNNDTLDLSLSSGVTSVTVQNSANTGSVVDLGAIANLTVQNQNKGVNFDNSTATTLNLTAANVGSTGQITIDLGASAASKAKTVNLTLNAANVEIKDTTGNDVIETLNVTATGKNTVKLTNGDSSITAVTVTGAGSVDLSNGGTVTLAALKTLDATKNDGGVTVKANTSPTSILTGKGADSVTVGALAANATISTGDGNDTITTGALVAGKTFTIDAGAGNDTIDLTGATAAAIVNLTAGDGDDIVKLGGNLNVLDAKSTIDGGAGTNTIGIADGANLTSATVKLLSNFQVLDITGGTGTYDVSLLAGANTTSATGDDFTGHVTLNNVLASTVTNITSAKATNLSIMKTLTFTPKDASGSADVITVNLKAVDGDNDGTAEGNITLADIKLTDDTASKGVETLRIVSTATPDADNPATTGTDESLKVTAYTNTITNVEGTAKTTTLDIQADAGLVITTVDASLTGLSTIKVAGAGDFVITNALDAKTLLTSVNASGSTGAVTIDASNNTKAINYVGSGGVDTYKAGTAGGVIYTGKGADVVDLTAGAAVRDTFVLKAATDSQLTDTNKDGKITLGADSGFDSIKAFATGGATTDDIIDLTNLGFTGAQRGVVDVSSKVTATTDLTSVADLFNDPAGDRGVAYTVISGDTYVFVDVNKDGDFSAASDLVVKLAGVSGIAAVDIAF